MLARTMQVASAIQTVHTSGINWASIATIVSAFAAIVTVLLTYINRRANKRDALQQQEIQQRNKEMVDLRTDFTKGLKDLGNLLSARLETKEKVAALDVRVARLEGPGHGMLGRPE